VRSCIYTSSSFRTYVHSTCIHVQEQREIDQQLAQQAVVRGGQLGRLLLRHTIRRAMMSTGHAHWRAGLHRTCRSCTARLASNSVQCSAGPAGPLVPALAMAWGVASHLLPCADPALIHLVPCIYVRRAASAQHSAACLLGHDSRARYPAAACSNRHRVQIPRVPVFAPWGSRRGGRGGSQARAGPCPGRAT
jgi:hypothetical protein